MTEASSLHSAYYAHSPLTTCTQILYTHTHTTRSSTDVEKPCNTAYILEKPQSWPTIVSEYILLVLYLSEFNFE